MSLNFHMTKAEAALIGKIMERAHSETRIGELQDRLTTHMDLAAVNNAVGLDLDAMLHAPPADFAHDIYGIRQNLDRRTGELGCFLPRCALPEKVL